MGEKCGSADMQAVHTSLVPGGDWATESLGEGQLATSMGYEQLLSIQQQQHALEMQQKDAEITHLKACLDSETNRNSPRSAERSNKLAAALRTQEEATTLLMAAKHKELELMVGLLQLREQQIEDFRQVCEAQKLEIQQLKRRRPIAELGGPNESMGSSLETVRSPDAPIASPGAIVASGNAQRSEGGFLSKQLRDKEEQQQTQREVRRLRLRMEELEAAMGEQHDRNAGLAKELETKIEKVKALEEQVRVLRSPTFDEQHFQSFRAQGSHFPGSVSPSSDLGRPGGEMSPGFGTYAASVGSVHLSSHGYENRGSHVSNAISMDSLDHTRFGSYVHNQLDHRPHGAHGLRRMHHRTVSSGLGLPVTNGVVSSPSLALPPLQSSSSLPRLPSDTPASAARYTPAPTATANGDSGMAVEAAAAYFLAKSNEHRAQGEAETTPVASVGVDANGDGRVDTYITGSDRNRDGIPDVLQRKVGGASNAAIRVESPRRSPVTMSSERNLASRDGKTSLVVTRVYPNRDEAASTTAPASARGNASSPSTLDAMALRRLGEEGHRHAHTEGDVTQSFMSASGQSQAHSYHSALRVDQTEADLVGTGRSTAATVSSEPPGETSRQSQELLQEMRRLRLRMSELEQAAGPRPRGDVVGARHRERSDGRRHLDGSEHVGASGSNNGELSISGADNGSTFSPGRGQATKSASSTAASKEPDSASWHWPQNTRSARSDQQIGSEFAGWEYRPHASGDPVDAAVASLVNRQGRYRGWRALLCRLDQGIYLCGTRRVHLRADLANEKIEASDDGGNTWSDLEVIMKGAEASQRALLERARDQRLQREFCACEGILFFSGGRST